MSKPYTDKRSTYNFPLFCAAVQHLGGRMRASEKLGVTNVAITHLYTGRNRLSQAMAMRLEQLTGGRFLAADLLGLTPSVRRVG